MKAILSILFVYLIGLTASAEMKLSVINDNDGYTNIRKGPGLEYQVIGIVEKDEFFYCEISSESDWFKIITSKWELAGEQLIGFIHKSRIIIIELQPFAEQQTIIENVLFRHKQLAEAFSISHSNRSELEIHSEMRYTPILGILPVYFCQSKDIYMMQLFLDAMCADRGSANEMPSYTIAECFICEPDIICDLIVKTKDQCDKELLINQLDFGLREHFNVVENVVSTDKEYLRLAEKLEKIKK